MVEEYRTNGRFENCQVTMSCNRQDDITVLQKCTFVARCSCLKLRVLCIYAR